MRIGTVTLVAASLILGAAASASELKALGLQAGPAATGVVAERQDLMKKLGGALRPIGGAVQAGGDLKAVAPQAADAAALARKIPDLFPAGSTDGSHALPTVWSDSAGFKAKAAALADATAKLAAATAAGDNAAATAAFGDVRKSCGDCHTGYRQAPPPRPATPPPPPAG